MCWKDPICGIILKPYNLSISKWPNHDIRGSRAWSWTRSRISRKLRCPRLSGSHRVLSRYQGHSTSHYSWPLSSYFCISAIVMSKNIKVIWIFDTKPTITGLWSNPWTAGHAPLAALLCFAGEIRNCVTSAFLGDTELGQVGRGLNVIGTHITNTFQL